MPDDERAPCQTVRRRLGEHLTQRTHLADALVVAGLDDGECLVEADCLPAA